MTSKLNIGELARIAKEALDANITGQEYMLEDVYNITRAAYEQYPEDTVIKQVAFTIEKMAEKAPSGKIISQADISGVYNHFVRLSGNSKFRDILGHLLLEDRTEFSSKSPDYTKMNRIDAENSGLDTSDFVNTNMVNALSAAFGGSVDAIKAFDDKVALAGVAFVEAELRALGYDKLHIEIMGGDQNILVYASHFDTRNGRVTVAIPAEVKDNRVLFPSTFVADDHLEQLTFDKLSYFVDKKSESNDFSVPKASDVLTAVGILTGHIKNASTEEMSEQFDGLFGESNSDIAIDVPNLYVERNYEVGRPDIDTTQDVEMPQELAHLSRDFEDSVLEAASTFGMNAITSGKLLIAQELHVAGFKNPQVRFGSENAGSVVYLATINTPKGPAEIEVPVDMQLVAGDKFVPLSPAYFAYDGLIEDFTAPKLQRFAINIPVPSSGTTSYSSAHSYMMLPELKDEILKAVSSNDYVTCEAALDEIHNRFTEEDFKNAIADYHFILMQKTHVENKEPQTCSKLIQAGKGSIYSRCGHFGVPLHKVSVDEAGNCRLKTALEREKMNPSDEGGASMSSAKIFMA